jgi:DNA-binding SARP family transcriptional activator
MAGGTVGPTVGAVDFRILGPLEVWYEGRPIPVPGAKQRALLAMLLLHAGEVVSADRMLDAVWGEDPPDAGSTALRVRLSQLRKTLAGAGSSLVTRPPGYVMQLRDDELDLRRCERLVAAGDRALQEGRAAEAVDALRDALALWRGPPLADLAYESFAQAPIVRLEELRLAALELRVEAELSLGHHGPLVGELQELVRLHPMRERLCCQLMLALYRDGRQSDALDAYRTARRRLVDEVGIEPGPQLQQLEGQILAQDPRLDLEPDASVRTAVRTPTRSVLVIADDDLEDIAAIAEPLAAGDGRELIVAALVTESDELDPALARLHAVRDGALERGASTRVTAFTSAARGDDVVRLAAEHEAALLLLALPDGALDDDTIRVLAHAVCDVGLVAGADRPAGGAEVLIPFAGSEHDWAAVELGSWLATATGAPVRLVGTRGDPDAGRRDASRLLASASLALQRGLGVAVEQALVGSGAGSMIEVADAAAAVVAGLSDRWVSQGIGPARLELARGARPPVILVRRGLRSRRRRRARDSPWSGVRG